MKKVLEIGPEKAPKANLIPGWEEAEVLTLDVLPDYEPDILCNADDIPAQWDESFDGVLASHVLEHFGFWYTGIVLEKWIRLLKPGGELHIVVPSAEWAARQILSEGPSYATFPHLFGSHINEYQMHKSAFTMRLLRVEFEKAGLLTRRATTGQYNISVNGEAYVAEQHYIMGVKSDIIAG